LRGAKNNKQHRVFDSKEEDKYMMSSNAKEVREAFFFTYEFFFLREVSFLQLLQYYDELRIIIMYHTIRVYFHLLLLVLVLFTLYYMYYISLALYCSMFQLLKNAGTPNAKSVGSFST